MKNLMNVCVPPAVLQTVQTVRRGDLPEERASALHGFGEGERSAVPAVLSQTGQTGDYQSHAHTSVTDGVSVCNDTTTGLVFK